MNKNSLNAFARAISRTRRPELDSHTLINGAYEAHPHADTINLLLSIGENTLYAINLETPVSPVPYAVSPHMDVNARIKVLNRRITIYRSELPNKNRVMVPMPKYLQIRQFIGQDLLSLEGCFPNQKQFVDYTTLLNLLVSLTREFSAQVKVLFCEESIFISFIKNSSPDKTPHNYLLSGASYKEWETEEFTRI